MHKQASFESQYEDDSSDVKIISIDIFELFLYEISSTCWCSLCVLSLGKVFTTWIFLDHSIINVYAKPIMHAQLHNTTMPYMLVSLKHCISILTIICWLAWWVGIVIIHEYIFFWHFYVRSVFGIYFKITLGVFLVSRTYVGHPAYK